MKQNESINRYQMSFWNLRREYCARRIRELEMILTRISGCFSGLYSCRDKTGSILFCLEDLPSGVSSWKGALAEECFSSCAGGRLNEAVRTCSEQLSLKIEELQKCKEKFEAELTNAKEGYLEADRNYSYWEGKEREAVS